MIPSLDRARAHRLARQLASLRALRSIDPNDAGGERLKLRLKSVSRRLLDNAQRRRLDEATSQVRSLSLDEGHGATEKSDRRRTPLEDAVGEARCREILSVSREIEGIRRRSALWTKFARRHRHSHPEQSRRDEGQAVISEDEEEERAVPVAASLPTPIADIYFRARLVDAVRAASGAGASSDGVRRRDWDALLREGRAQLAAFRAFEGEHARRGSARRAGARSLPYSKRGMRSSAAATLCSYPFEMKA